MIVCVIVSCMIVCVLCYVCVCVTLRHSTCSRGKKRQRNKQFRCAVNGTKAAGPQLCDQAVEVTWVECEEALVDLQLTSRTVVRMCEGGSQLADLVITFTKALAETPYKYVHVWC